VNGILNDIIECLKDKEYENPPTEAELYSSLPRAQSSEVAGPSHLADAARYLKPNLASRVFIYLLDR
jgi:hypothetical protein